jgi:hypothetical protein
MITMLYAFGNFALQAPGSSIIITEPRLKNPEDKYTQPEDAKPASEQKGSN